jgi:hypothetical protein
VLTLASPNVAASVFAASSCDASPILSLRSAVRAPESEASGGFVLLLAPSLFPAACSPSAMIACLAGFLRLKHVSPLTAKRPRRENLA